VSWDRSWPWKSPLLSAVPCSVEIGRGRFSHGLPRRFSYSMLSSIVLPSSHFSWNLIWPKKAVQIPFIVSLLPEPSLVLQAASRSSWSCLKGPANITFSIEIPIQFIHDGNKRSFAEPGNPLSISHQSPDDPASSFKKGTNPTPGREDNSSQGHFLNHWAAKPRRPGGNQPSFLYFFIFLFVPIWPSWAHFEHKSKSM